MDKRIGSGYIPATIALVLFLLSVTPVMADEYVGGIPVETMESGIVSGGLYHDAVFGFDYAGPNGTIADGAKTVEKVFTLPHHTEVKWARLYVAVYCGNMKSNYQADLEVRFDGDADGTYDRTWNERLNTDYTYPGEGGSGPVDLGNGNRVTGDYLYWYDVKEAIGGTSVKTLVKTSKPEGYTGTFDGRIKLVALVVAYEDGSTDRVHYWVNQGHDVSSYLDDDYKGRISFDTSGLSGVDPDSADLTVFHMASANGDLWVAGEPVTGTEPQGSYSGSYLWNVSDQIGGSGVNFEYRNNKDVYFFKIPLAFLAVKYPAPSAQVDLTIAGTVNPVPADAVFAREPNLVRITDIENKGSGVATNIPVALYASDVDDGTVPVNTTTVDTLASGAKTTVTLIDPTIRDLEGGTVTYTAAIDPEETIAETNRTNNNKSSAPKPVLYNGYKGKRWTPTLGGDMETQVTFSGRYDIVYSHGDSAYRGAKWPEQTVTWSADDLTIPDGATVVDARLYQGWGWNKMTGDPAPTVTFNGADAGVPVASYKDRKNWGSYDYPYGLYVYNVTNQFDAAGNTMTLTPEAGNDYFIYGAYLVVVYEDPATTEKQILINEEFDMVCSHASYSVNNDEATVYAPFSGIDTAGIAGARAIAILASADEAGKSRFFFNDQEYTGFWESYLTTPQIGFSVYDVTDVLQDGTNEARIQSFDAGANGDSMYAMATILVTEYTDSALPADLTVTAIKPNAGAGDNIFANEPNEISVMVENLGAGPAGASTLMVDVGGTKYTEQIDALAPGTNTTVTITHNILYAHGAVVNVTATADSGDLVDESDETNNALTVDLIVYDNGYKGKRWTHTLGGDMKTQATFSGRYDIVYSHGNSTKQSAKWSEQTVTWSAENLTIPEGATVVDARLYQAWGWNKMTTDPAPTVTFNGIAVGAPVASYKDRKNWGTYDYPYGLYVYDVTDRFDAAGNTMTLTPEAGNDYFTYGAYLVVVYEDPKTTEKQILINEEFDMVCSRASYSVNNDEATVYAPFSGVTTTDLTGARAIAILASAGEEGKSKFFFNDREYTGFWESYKGDPEIGFSVYDVTDALQDGVNEARLQSFDTGSGGDSMYAMTTILVAEYADSALPDLTVSTVKPNAGAGDNIFANEPNKVSVMVENQGAGSAGASTLLIDFDGAKYTEQIGSLAPGANETVTITHDTLYAHGAVVNVTATADSGSVVDESNETNNVLSANLTVYDNGYKGKRWTHTLGGDMKTQATFSGRYDIVYSHGNSTKQSAKWSEQTVTWSAENLTIPEGATVVDARLYQAWGWNKMTTDPAPTVTFNGIAVGAPVASYKDRKNWGTYDYPYGLYVYNVTDQFDTAGNTMTLTPEAGNDYLLYGAYLVVVYEDPATTEKQILVNEEFDMVCSRASYSVNNDEATVYAPFSGIDTAGIAGARAIAILASADEEGKSKFFFNDQEYTGFWEDYLATPQIGFSVYDVTEALQDGTNEARIQSFDTGTNGDSMYAMATILVAEYTASGGAPVANFTGTPTTGDAPLEVRFADTSIGKPVQWIWEFGDGRVATTRNPIITYRQPGTYTVNLTVSNDFGSDFEVKTNYITVNRPDPVASFTADHTSGNADLAVQFTDTSTGNPNSYSWDFGDGANSTVPNPAHTYTTAGTYTVTLEVRRDSGPASTTTEQITVKPVAGFTADTTRGNTDLAVQFTDTSTGNPDSYSWDFGDGGSSSDQNPAHTYTTAGIYTVTLTVTGGGQVHTEAKKAYITVVDPGALPAAEFRADTIGGYAPLTVRFFDQSQGDVNEWLWSFGDGATSSDQNPAHTYTAAGTYTVKLTAKKGSQSNAITKTAYVTVDDPRPVADFTVTRLRGEAPLTVQFTDTSTGAPPLTRAWDFGDGTSSTLRNPTHVFDHDSEGARTYTVTLTVTNSGGSDVKTTAITVVAPPQKEDVTDRVDQTNATAIEDVPLTYQDLRLEIPKGHAAKQADGNPITELSVGVAPVLEEPPAGTIEIGGKAFKLGPAGAKFDPAIPISITFTEDEWKKLFGDGRTTKIQRYDGTNWVELENQTGDDATFTITGYTSSFSTFAPVTTTTGPTPEPTAAPPSSGGGGGSQTSVGAASNLKAGDRAVLSMDQTAISAVTFTAKNQIKDVMVTMAKGSLPRDAKPPAGTVYQYIEATLYRAAADDFSSIQFRFAVPASWLDEQGCTKDGVRLFRLTGEGWREVPVEVLGEESGNAIFTANPEGFSLFAITAAGKAPGVTEPTQEPTETVTTPPADVTRPPAGTTPTTPQPTPFPVWAAVTALGASLLLVRRRA